MKKPKKWIFQNNFVESNDHFHFWTNFWRKKHNMSNLGETGKFWKHAFQAKKMAEKLGNRLDFSFWVPFSAKMFVLVILLLGLNKFSYFNKKIDMLFKSYIRNHIFFLSNQAENFLFQHLHIFELRGEDLFRCNFYENNVEGKIRGGGVQFYWDIFQHFKYLLQLFKRYFIDKSNHSNMCTHYSFVFSVVLTWNFYKNW